MCTPRSSAARPAVAPPFGEPLTAATPLIHHTRPRSTQHMGPPTSAQSANKLPQEQLEVVHHPIALKYKTPQGNHKMAPGYPNSFRGFSDVPGTLTSINAANADSHRATLRPKIPKATRATPTTPCLLEAPEVPHQRPGQSGPPAASPQPCLMALYTRPMNDAPSNRDSPLSKTGRSHETKYSSGVEECLCSPNDAWTWDGNLVGTRSPSQS